MKTQVQIFLAVTNLFLFIICTVGQTSFVDTSNIREFNIFFKDIDTSEIDKGIEAKGIVSLDNESMVIATYSWNYGRSYVIRLDADFSIEWKLAFEDRRIQKISKLSNGSIVVAGDRIDMQKFWICTITLDGKIGFLKEYKKKSQCVISNMEIDEDGNIILLIEAIRKPLLQVKQLYGKKRLLLLKNVETYDIYLFNITSSGKIIWKTKIDNTKKFSKYGLDLLIVDDKIYVTTIYSGFISKNKSLNLFEGRKLFKLNEKGKIIDFDTTSRLKLLYYDTNLKVCNDFQKDSLFFFQGDVAKLHSSDTVVFKECIEQFWISKFIRKKNASYITGSWHQNLGYLLMKIDSSGKYVGCWKDKMDNGSTTLVDVVVRDDRTIILVGNQSRKNNNEAFGKVNINILILREYK